MWKIGFSFSSVECSCIEIWSSFRHAIINHLNDLEARSWISCLLFSRRHQIRKDMDFMWNCDWSTEGAVSFLTNADLVEARPFTWRVPRKLELRYPNEWENRLKHASIWCDSQSATICYRKRKATSKFDKFTWISPILTQIWKTKIWFPQTNKSLCFHDL